MRVFVLEDNQGRCDWFAKYLTEDEEEFTIVKTAKEAKDVLSKEKFDFLFLDHDLGDKVFVDIEDENTGTQVVRHMIKNKLQQDAEIIVHSQNPASFDSMIVPLQKNGYDVVFRPFSLLYAEIERQYE